ncbi:hypothetical protein TRFO_27343 [Tritrichomonas foetus]|uniref:Uncharacterized protein n=1 Tax=Tritrichomonas foetus TaxID=1144522 RepID=A0A1J4K5M6_9EUKA|nr:hypothetical protein TRFO_27343 [Tritrichomonas foetus]|eukprot:OHT05028.1 hypothetical protein TRFO_27343 [Tritrichomonas foetus]
MRNNFFPDRRFSTSDVAKLKKADQNNQNQTKEQIEKEINLLDIEYHKLLNESRELDQSLEFIKEKFHSESTSLQNIIQKNKESINALKMTVKAVLTDSPLNVGQELKLEIEQLTKEIEFLNSNQKNLHLSYSNINKDLEELNFLIDAVPFEHNDIFNLAEQKIKHQINKDIIEHQISTTEASSKKESLEIEIRMASSIISELSKTNFHLTKKIDNLKQKRQELRRELNEANQNRNNFAINTIPFSQLQKILKNKEIEKEKELNEIDSDFAPMFKKLENEQTMVKSEIDERIKITEELNQRINELVTEYERKKSNRLIKIQKLNQKHANELFDIQSRYEKIKEEALADQKRRLESNLNYS